MRPAACAAALLLCALSLQAITYIVPSDRDLVRRASAIVVAGAAESHSEITADDRVVTITSIDVEESLKGPFAAGERVRVSVPGGLVGTRGVSMPGAPQFTNGKRYLLFLTTNFAGEWVPWSFGLGKFDFAADLRGRQLLTRGALGDDIVGWDEADSLPHVEHLRDAEQFLTFVRGAVADDRAPLRSDYFVDHNDVFFGSFPEFHPAAASLKPSPNFIRTDYLWNYPGYYRWSNGGHAALVYTGTETCCTQTTAFNAALGNWNGQGTSVAYTSGGSTASCTCGFLGGGADGKNCVTFGDTTCLAGAGAPNTASVGGITTESGTYVGTDGLTYHNPSEVDVFIGSGVNTNQTTFNGLVTHEVGHTLGFRHSDRDSQNNSPCPNTFPCSSTAIMTTTIPFNTGSLQQWDRDAVQTVYGSGPTCTAVGITSVTAIPTSISSGSSSSLSVAATGATPLSYQWYIGSPGNTSQPVAGGTNPTISVAPTSTTSYWVRVSNSCPSSMDSSAVTVTVTPATCTSAAITSATATPSTISAGSSSTLNVSATGTGPLSYQWYAGPVGTTSSPVAGGNQQSVSVSPSSTTSYWVRVSNSCPSSMDSSAVTVTVTPATCTPVAITSATATPSTITAGSFSTLSVSASGTGPLSYQWYAGPVGTTSSPLASGNQQFVSVSPSSTTSYWVQVTNGCPSSANSSAVTVTVNTNTCTPPTVTGQTQDQTVTSGSTATLSVGYSGTSGVVTWYQGVPTDRTHPIGSGQSVITTPLTATTTFWAEVVNSCGTAPSRTVTVTVTQTCVAPAIIAATATPQQVAPGSTVMLDVNATGSSLQYQWFRGQPQDTSNPVANGTTATITDTPSATTTYWVRVTNSCGQQDSGAVTVTVSSTCPAITINSISGLQRVSSNGSATLAVDATGGTLHYQWFNGTPSGDTNMPVGSDAPSFTSAPLFSNTTFWVKVTNDCGNSVNSSAIQVVVVPAKHRASHH